jgi:hypothetical protein
MAQRNTNINDSGCIRRLRHWLSPYTGAASARRRAPAERLTSEAERDVLRKKCRLSGLIAVLALGALGGLQPAMAEASSYDQLIRSHNAAMYLAMSSPGTGREADLSGRGHTGTYHPAGSYPSRSRLPNGDPVAAFNGATQYLEVPDANDLSVTSRGELTIEAWIRPDTLQFPSEEGSGYVHFLGKGAPNQHEYVARMYSKVNDEDRPNRISGYAFKLAGGLGSGSYFQVPVQVGEWILVDIVINTRNTSTSYPTGYVKIFRNGQLKDTTGLDQFDVVPRNGTAPLRVATRDFASYFRGALGKVALYLHELAPDQILSHHRAMLP